jgi:hypothetical protein
MADAVAKKGNEQSKGTSPLGNPVSPKNSDVTSPLGQSSSSSTSSSSRNDSVDNHDDENSSLPSQKKTHQSSFLDCYSKALEGSFTVNMHGKEVLFDLWWHHNSGPKPKKSPEMFVSSNMKCDLLHRLIPLGLVVQHNRNATQPSRIWMIDSTLLDADGVAFGYLEGLYREKCSPLHVLAVVVPLNFEGLIFLRGIKSLHPYTCDRDLPIPPQSKVLHDAYFKTRVWHEEGIISADGKVQKKCIHYDSGWAGTEPDFIEPGMLLIL